MGMTDRDKKLLSVFLVLIVLGGYWFLVLGKKRDAVAQAEQARSQAQMALDSARSAATQGKQEKKRYPVSYAKLLKLGKAVPQERDFASLLVQLNDVADAAHVDFVSLTSGQAAVQAAGGATGTTGSTTCDAGTAAGASGATGATGATGAAPAPAATGGATGPTDANTGVGQAINNANSTAANANAGAAPAAEDCAEAPTLTDLTAVSSGLALTSYDLRFKGNFFDLHKVFARLLNMVDTRNGKVKVTGRLLQINGFDLSVDEFPRLEASVRLTGYRLPKDASAAAGATASAPAATPAPTAAPPAAAIGAR